MRSEFSPVRIEREYQFLRTVLSQPVSVKYQLFAITEFLSSNDLEGVYAEPYILEISESLTRIATELKPEGLDPRRIERFIEYFEKEASLIPHLLERDELIRAVSRLREICVSQYAYAGDLKSVLRLLHVKDDIAQQMIGRIRSTTAFERFQELAGIIEHEGLPQEPSLSAISGTWISATRLDPGQTYVPVVERLVQAGSSSFSVPALRKITLDLFKERIGSDDIRGDVVVFGADNSLPRSHTCAFDAARALLKTHKLNYSDLYFAGRIHYDTPDAMHEGNSDGVAVAAAFFCAVLKWIESRTRYRMVPTTAITGEVDEDGMVLAVEGNSLGVKVRAAFFSWIDTLVVPQSQQPEAEEILQLLQKDFPHRDLKIIGISHLSDMLYDRRITSLKRVGYLPHLSGKVWTYRYRVGTAAIICFLILGLVFMLYGPIDRNPEVIEFSGERMLVRNTYGQLLDDVFVGHETASWANSDITRAYIVFDVDGDGSNEYIWRQLNGEEQSILCKKIGQETPLWTLPIRYSSSYPQHPEDIDPYYMTAKIHGGDLDADGEVEIWVLANHHILFPSVLLKVDALTGDVLGVYLHAGGLVGFVTADLEDDGISEIILTGTNNGFRSAVMVVLDPRFIGGQSPSTDRYRAEAIEAATERMYARIPQTLVGHAMRYRSGSPSAYEIRALPQDKRFMIAVRDVHLIQASSQLASWAGYFIELDRSLRPVGFSADNGFDAIARYLVDEGILDHIPDRSDFEKLKEEFLYWNGSSWSHESIENERYRTALMTASSYN